MRHVLAAVAAGLALTAAGCLDVSHRCTDSTQCVQAGVAGVCEPSGTCSFATADAAEVDGEPAIDAPSDDDDGDGVKNTADNCRLVANADQHDEDADTVGDVCDVCPHVADPPQLNGDGDGLGDACDPRPGTARNHLVLFDPFARAQSAWVVQEGAWAEVGDTMRVTGGTGVARIWRPITVPGGSGLIVETRVTVLSIAANSTVYAGIAGPVDFAAGSGSGCAIHDNTTNMTELEIMSVAFTPTALVFSRTGIFNDAIGPLTATITHTRTGSFRCDAAIDGESRGGGYSGSDAPIAGLGLFARNVTATYAYVLAYTD